jgi:hypothetical protein
MSCNYVGLANHDNHERKRKLDESNLTDDSETNNDESTRGRNATRLAKTYPMPGDPRATFEEETHTYTVDGVVVAKSCTGAKADLFPHMDSMLTIDKYYASWKRNESNKYNSMIWQVLEDQSKSDDDAKAAIADSWKALGKVASDLGTLVHLYIELYYNDTPMQAPHDIQHEVALFHQFVASPFYKQRELEMVRTELTVFDKRGDIPVCAGQIDGLMKDKNGKYYIFDWKRSKHVLKPTVRAFNDETGTHPITKHIPNTDYHKYSLQLSLYAAMLPECHNIDVEDRLYLVRLHPELHTYELTKCEDYRCEAKQILDMMHETLRSNQSEHDQ